MKKFMISLAIASIAMVSFAQEVVSEVVVPTKKHQYVTNSFGSNWFMGVNGGVNLFDGVYTNGESVFDHVSPAVQVYVGKWHTPGFGWRVAYNGLFVKPYEDAGNKLFTNVHFDAMFNLTNLLLGYDEYRVWNFVPYAGIGSASRKCHQGSGFTGSLSANLGVMNTFRVAKHWAINLEFAAAFLRNGFGGAPSENSGCDMMYTALAGITYKFNRVGWDQAADIVAMTAMNTAALAELNTQLLARETENAGLKNQLTAAKTSIVKAQEALDAERGKIFPVSQSVFFAFNSSKINSKKEIINLQALADAVKEVNAKIAVVGYADSATGSAAYNQKLSEKRTDAVVEKLVELGVPRANIMAESKGGVDTEKLARLNRRVIISIVE